MRSILFRGKRVDNGEWVFGSYHCCTGLGTLKDPAYEMRKWIERDIDFNCHWILERSHPNRSGWDIKDSFQAHQVISETVGQFTDRTDKKNNPIYDGDYLETMESPYDNIYRTYKVKVIWDKGTWSVKGLREDIDDSDYLWDICEAAEICGNVFDTSER